jgi:hypothetical protein
MKFLTLADWTGMASPEKQIEILSNARIHTVEQFGGGTVCCVWWGERPREPALL